MLKPENYFDNAATTPVDPRVIREMLPYFETHWGNANSLHAWGREAMEAVDRARHLVAAMIGAEDPSQIVFTSGATESNNWVIRSADIAEFANSWKSVISPFEHNAMREPALHAGCGFIENDGLGLQSPTRENEFHFVSLMSVNNEIGSKFSPRDFLDGSEILHSDITQAVGKVPIDLEILDYASFSAHKFYGPKGVGALYCATNPPKAFILGGEQEQGARGGTLNVPGIVGMGAAAAIAQDEQRTNLAKTEELRAIVLEALRPCKDYQVNGGNNVSPYILSLSFRGIEGETLVIEMDQQGYAISSGAACSSRSTDPSHVLTALKMPKEWLRGTIRISFGALNTKESAASLGKSLLETVGGLRKLRTI